MNVRRWGRWLMGLSLALFALDLVSGRAVSGWGARWRCGPDYLAEIDGLLSEQSCGFDADMTLVACAVVGVGAGWIMTVIGRFSRP